MRARTRLILDAALLVAFIAAFEPGWTGVPFHQWLGLALAIPVLVHLVVNWEWVVRTARKVAEKLAATSRANFVVDVALFVSTVTVTVSGFMVSPGLLGLVGIHLSQTLLWSVVHLWSANATIALIGVHFALHGSWFLATFKKLIADKSAPERSAAPGGLRRTGGAAVADTRHRAAAERRLRATQRRVKARRERASAFSAASAVAVSALVAACVLAAVAAASPLVRTSGHRVAVVARAGSQACPKTGCVASSCHGSAGAAPAAFYARTATGRAEYARFMSGAGAAKRLASPANASAGGALALHAAPSATTRVLMAAATSRRLVATPAASRAKATAASSGSAKSASSGATRSGTHLSAAKHVFVCPVSGCHNSRCHGAAGVSPSKFYR